MKTYYVKKTDDEVNALLNKCCDQEDKGGSQFPGMTYEQGVKAGIEWLIGNSDNFPLE